MFTFDCGRPTVLCARENTTSEAGGNVCSGDSGGFLGVTRAPGEQWTVDGVASYTFDSAEGVCLGMAGGFSPVADYLSWIEDNTDL